MAAGKVSYSKLTHDVVQSSPEPLPFVEIVERVNAITPITTKKPKQTIRGAIGESHMIVSTGDGRYGWKPRLIDGSLLRHTIQTAEPAHNRMYWDQEIMDALWPTFFAKQRYMDRSPVHVTLADNTRTELSLEVFSPGIWGTPATPEFWDWFHSLEPDPGDHLLFEVVDGETREYRITFQRRTDRDEEVIAARNEELVAIGLELMKRPYGITRWDFTTHLLATGFYRQPVPPDPFSEVWHAEAMAPALYEEDQEPDEPETGSLATDLFGQGAQEYDIEDPPDLPREYDPSWGRRQARKSGKARKGTVTSYTVRVNHRALPEIWRDIELAEDNTLEDLHLTFQMAFRWFDDHLYSFFLSGEAWDRHSEIGSPWSDSSLHTHQVQIGQLELREDQTFLYLFDYGDNHEFDVTVLNINPLAPKAAYPRIVNYHGEAPPQYPEIDEESGEMSWDPYQHWRS